MKRQRQRMMCLLLSANIVLSQGITDVMAAPANTQKEEVVYGMLDESGNVTGIYVVNSFTDSQIVDYGDYSEIRNLTTTDKLTMQDGKITGNSGADKLYYQGNLKTSDLPWRIEIHYYMDGKECEPREIAGMNGKLKIGIKITQNEACDERFWNGYALQITMALDSTKCKNIRADQATIANVGANKQLSYIILPGKGADLAITADVTDFEMDEIEFHGTKMNLNLEIDSSKLYGKVGEIQDAVGELRDGAFDLKEGSSKLKNGAGQVYDGSQKLKEGAASLNGGVNSLSQGMSSLNLAVKKLNGKSESLTSGSKEVLSGLHQIKTSNSQMNRELKKAGIEDASSLASLNKQAVASLKITDTQRTLYTAYLLGGEAAVQQKLQKLAASGDQESVKLAQEPSSLPEYLKNAGTLIQLEALLQADAAYIQGSAAMLSGAASIEDEYKKLDSGINEYTNAVSSVQNACDKLYKGTSKLSEGSGRLCDSTSDLVSGTRDLYSGSEELNSGTLELKNGTREFYEETAGMDTEISDTIDDTIDEMTGKNVDTVSFVSDQNTNITSVLFVIKTPAIEVREVEEKEVSEQAKKGFRDKLSDLFWRR